MDSYDHRSNEESIAGALEQLHAHNFCTLGDYEQLVSSGVLVKKPLFVSDYEFLISNPHHPLSTNSLTPRVRAGDAIRDTAEQLRLPLCQDLLDGIHTALFDCSGAVRHSLAQALIYTDSSTSVPHLQELIRIEKRSKLVLAAAGAALINAQMDTEGYVQPGDKVIMLISRQEDLIIRLSKVAEQTGSKLFMPRREFSELTQWRSEVQVVDRCFMGSQNWNSYCQHLQDLDREEVKPLILVGDRRDTSEEHFAVPFKPKHSLFYVATGTDDLVGEIVRRTLKGENMDLTDIIDTVNMQRMGLESW